MALDWKWLFIYPDQHVATVNGLVIPAGQPVHLSLTSGTVMQSLLMPRLASQIYAMAGMTTQLNFAADGPGDYLGENVQFNGAGFQNQKFDVAARRPTHFNSWLAGIKAQRTCSMSPATKPCRSLHAAASAYLRRRRPRAFRWHRQPGRSQRPHPRHMQASHGHHRHETLGIWHFLLGNLTFARAAFRAGLARSVDQRDHRRRRWRNGRDRRNLRSRSDH